MVECSRKQVKRGSCQCHSKIAFRADSDGECGGCGAEGIRPRKGHGRQGVPVKMQTVPAPPVRQRSSVFCARAQFA